MEIVRSGSFEIAARKLHVTPSAISQRIKQLEDQLGQVLIVRGVIPVEQHRRGKRYFGTQNR
ncbi:LysR family transcriptional regulator [Pectobacterium versatile]|uniref:LysR family transcriptional regulator n=1 Tax=Pectobacterium versatile TaxID=2488639 RepID=UPI001FA6B2AD|nr:LysR family transcriptional regulator [Pectobacterium versatile]UNE77756.1 LysR family transcriptional regulator [Pectobacterium versatile]